MVIEILLVAVLLLLLGQLATGRRRDPGEYRLAEVERRLGLVMSHLGVVDPEPQLTEVREQLARGDKIRAIAAYRRVTGADLGTAKAAVEALAGRR